MVGIYYMLDMVTSCLTENYWLVYLLKNLVQYYWNGNFYSTMAVQNEAIQRPSQYKQKRWLEKNNTTKLEEFCKITYH